MQRSSSTTTIRVVVTNHRRASGLMIAIGGSLYALLFGGGTFAMCLGPLGVTAVRCAAHSGIASAEGQWIGIIVAAIGLGMLTAIARTHISWPDTVAALGGAGLGGIWYFVRRPVTLEGPDYDGTWLVFSLPVAYWTLLAWTVAGALVGLSVIAIARAISDQRKTG